MLKRISIGSIILVILASITFPGCSKSGSSNNGLLALLGLSGNRAPEQLTYSTTSAVYTLDEAISNNVPTVTGLVTSWTVVPALPDGLTLDGDTGVIYGTPISTQTATEYTIVAANNYGTASITISITINLDPPSELAYSTTSAVYTLGETITNNTPSVTGTVTSWSVSPALPDGLSLNTSSGVISGSPTTEQAAADYVITASNLYGSTTATISITVNLDPPSGLSYSTTSAVYTVDRAITNNVPTVTGSVTSWSSDPALPDGLSIDPYTGVISGTPTDLQSAHYYTITAGNSYGSDTALISITVNSAAPSGLTYSTTSAIYTEGVAIANNIPSCTGTVTSWSIDPALPNGLTLNTTTGVISGTPDTIQSVKNYTITAGNSGGSTTVGISITVNQAVPTNLHYSPTSAVYTQGAVIANNVPTYSGTATSWSVNPALPSGLTLNTTTGVISGTPAASQAATTYTITAGNPYGSTTAMISVTVNSSAPSALSYPTTSAVYAQGAVITNNVPTYNGTVVSWSVSPALPGGLALNTSTGVISGTPSAAHAATSYTVTATNSYGSATAVISITINSSAPTALTYSPTSAVYTQGAAIASNTPSYSGTVSSWSVTPALPAGLTLNTSTGVISGAPTTSQAATSYTVTATNVYGSTTAVISITVNTSAPTALSYSPASAVYSQGAAIANNTPAYLGTVASWSVSPSLPAGLTLNTSTGVISGTPTTSQAAASYTVTATNVYGSTTAVISITVNTSAPTALSYSPATAVYSQGAVIANNTPAYLGTVSSWSIDPALPAGLAMNTSTGVISGTPTDDQAATTYTVTATNAYGSTTALISIAVNSSAPSALAYSTPAAVYTRSEAIADNTPAYYGTVTSWSISPALPDGLTLNTTTGVISGTPTRVQINKTYTITATNPYGSTSTNISVAVSNATAGVLADIDFETGDSTQCDNVIMGGSDTLSVSTENPLDGLYGLKYVSAGDAAATYVEKTFTSQPYVYARCNFYITNVFSSTYEPMMFLLGLYDSSGTTIAAIGITGDWEPYRIILPYYVDDGAGYYKGDELTLSIGWHCVEVYYSTGPGTGAFSFYLDGILSYSATGLSNSSRASDRIRVGAVPFEGCEFDPGSTLYFDNIKVSTSYNGFNGYVLQEDLTSGAAGLVRVGGDSSTKYLSSSFTASSSHSLSLVNIKLNNQSPSTSILHLYLYSDDGSGNPSALLATALNTVDTATIPVGGGVYFPKAWRFDDYPLTVGVKYHLVIMMDDTSGSAQIGILCAGATGENIEQDADGTAPFSMTWPGAQFRFQTYSKE